MRKLTVIFACIVGIALLAWLTGLISLGYHCLVLCLAFLAEYLTPQHTPVPPIDRAWHAWWQIGVAARWAYYQHDRALQQSTQDDAVLIGVGFVLVLFLFIPWKSVRLKASSVHGTAHWATWSEARAFFAPLLGRARHESSLPLGRYKGRSLALKEKQLEEH